MSSSREITWDDLEALALGTGVLDGGDAYTALPNARKLYRHHVIRRPR